MFPSPRTGLPSPKGMARLPSHHLPGPLALKALSRDPPLPSFSFVIFATPTPWKSLDKVFF